MTDLRSKTKKENRRGRTFAHRASRTIKRSGLFKLLTANFKAVQEHTR